MKQIPLFQVRSSPAAIEAVARVLASGYLGEGPVVVDFERRLIEFLGVPRLLTVNSATSGLTLALRLVRDALGEGEVLTQPITCTATNWPILAVGQRIRWVDTDPRDGNMDLEDLRRQLSPQTRAILLVHWGGYPNDLDRVRAIQDECAARFGHRPAVIEDAAHALGSLYAGRMVGQHGNYVVFSFQAIKTLTTGDGGALVCPDEVQHARARLLRWFGLDRTHSASFRCDQDIQDWGYKFHMNDINAAIGRANLAFVRETLEHHRRNALCYREALAGVPGIRLLDEREGSMSSSWLFTLRAERRDDLQRKLAEHGIEASRVHERNDRYTCTRAFRTRELPGTDVFHREMLCIPVGWWVTPADRQRVVDVIRRGW
jgi:dTDP-4-amino-4,6-dideoxygalactose transaminase